MQTAAFQSKFSMGKAFFALCTTKGPTTRYRSIHVIASQRARWRGNPLQISNSHRDTP